MCVIYIRIDDFLTAGPSQTAMHVSVNECVSQLHLRLGDLDPLMKHCPDHTLVAGRRRQRAVVAVVACQVFREQGLDVEAWDGDPLICQ